MAPPCHESVLILLVGRLVQNWLKSNIGTLGEWSPDPFSGFRLVSEICHLVDILYRGAIADWVEARVLGLLSSVGACA